ncbi:alpha/beta-hydrolase [Delitschia confertaspora ATCC 74209]|uniref:Alpha/beta-hydrolase n=1 Tax=Delitschia confertaspora ATCC 74209 TaxID=1513339 RepID=A0A9P4JSQ8_9PLEO|nr:alpha/beta-hydrolase [Delitschia confertaspora ATCC 74209]
MATFDFDVKEHVIPCQHIRGYPNATKGRQNAALKLAVKEYRPKGNVDPQGITVIGAHGIGLIKEAYEPFWEELRVRLGGRLKAIWIADVSHQGASGVLNENLQGDDPNWFDHSRDLLGMVNHFRDYIQQPIVGIAHSMGCAQLVQLSIIHPRLFQGLILMEPIIQERAPPGPNAAYMTSYRPDFWDSMEEARAFFLKGKFYKTWDPRALDKYLQHGLRKTPTALYPNAPPSSVTLTTTKHQESWSYVRSTFAPVPPEDKLNKQERILTTDLMTPGQASVMFSRAEPALALHFLPYVQVPILWVFAQKSYINGDPVQREDLISRAGTAVRGSGGRESGAVESVVVEKVGHLMPLEKVEATADAITPFLKKQLEDYRWQEKFWDSYDSEKSERNMLAVSKKWLAETKKKSDIKRPRGEESKL